MKILIFATVDTQSTMPTMTISKTLLAIIATTFTIGFFGMVCVYWRSERIHDQHDALMQEQLDEMCDKHGEERLKRMELEEKMAKHNTGAFDAKSN